ncbi:MAG: flagella basal body P-ring formation protein FlgA [Betaproteobacteria bacterium]|nr:flagella basal body P-ring formation protein FlgA [Betaproteobacteria bacterium]
MGSISRFMVDQRLINELTNARILLHIAWLIVFLASWSPCWDVHAQTKSQVWESAIERAIGEQSPLAGHPFEIAWPATRPNWPDCQDPKVQLSNLAKPVGRIYVSLRCDSPRWLGSIQPTVSARKRYLAAVRPLSLGSIVSESDLMILEADWSSLPEDVLSDPEQAIGRTISRTVLAGQAIGLNFLRQTAVIKQGERVRVQMVGLNFTVGGEAVAIQQGAVGEAIRVKMASGQVVSATVIRSGLVEIRID